MGTRIPEPIWLTLHPSRLLSAYLLLLHAAALYALWLLQLSVALRALGALAVCASIAWQMRRHVLLRGSRAVRRLQWRSDGGWWVTDGAGGQHVYQQAETRLVRPWLILLRLEGRAGGRNLVLPGDCADAGLLRKLRVRLRRQPLTDQSDPLRGT